MDTIFTILSEALNTGGLPAILGSFGWGVLSVLLSPCHLTTIPLIIGVLAGQGEKKVSRGLLLSSMFAVGILVTIAVLGFVTAILGRIMGDVGPVGNYFTAAVLMIIGLALMDILHLPALGISLQPVKAASQYLSAFILGLVVGIALGPCTFAFLAPVLTLVFRLSDSNPAAGGTLLLAFAFGHCLVIAAAGGIACRVQAYLEWTRRSKAVLWTKKIAGALVLVSGIYVIIQA